MKTQTQSGSEELRQSCPAVTQSSNAAELAKGIFRFERKTHLKGRKDIQAVFKRGASFGCRGAKLFVLKNNLVFNRICFTFSRGFGIAVQRNRARRLGRESYRLLQGRLKNGYDMILLMYPDAKPLTCTPAQQKPAHGGMTFAARSRQLEFLFSKAGLLE